MDERTNPNSEGQNFLKWDFFADPKVIADFVDPVFDCVVGLSTMRMGRSIQVLDLGTGTGIILKELKKKVSQRYGGFHPVSYYGIDCQKDLIAQNKNDSQGIVWMTMDNKDTLFKSQIFDVVIARAVYHYEDNPADQEKLLREAHRVLKNHGYFFHYSPALNTEIEADLINRFYKVLPKSIRMTSAAEFYAMHRKVFGNARFLPNPNSLNCHFTAEYMRDRYHFNLQQQMDICEMIKQVPAAQRPNFGESNSDFWFTVPQKIIRCQKGKSFPT